MASNCLCWRAAGAGVAAFALLALGGCATIGRQIKFPELRERLSADCAAGRFSGVMAVQRHDRVLFLHSCGWRNPERRTPIGHDDRYKIFSISKSLTGAALLRLVQRGRIDLDAPLSQYLSDAPEAWTPVTVRHLLHHRSGIRDHTEKLAAAYLVGGERSHVSAMTRALALLNPSEAALLGPAGQEWRYSNFNYELLAHIAATVEGRPFHEILKDEVFIPAQMTTASVQLADPDSSALRPLPSPGLVTGFIGSADQARPVVVNYSFIQQGAGAVVVGYRDLLAFGRAMQRGRIWSRAMRVRNVTESVVTDRAPTRYGYGWLIRPLGQCNYWQHSGGTQGYAADLAVAPEEGVTVAILSTPGSARTAAAERRLSAVPLAGGGTERAPPRRPNWGILTGPGCVLYR